MIEKRAAHRARGAEAAPPRNLVNRQPAAFKKITCDIDPREIDVDRRRDPYLAREHPREIARAHRSKLCQSIVQVTFPLSPRAMLIMTWRDPGRPTVTLPREPVDALNRLRAFHASKFLYGPIDDKRIRRLASKFKGSRPRLSTQGFGPEKEGPIEVPRRWTKRE